MGRFVTFEGIDGSGKSTQLRLLEAQLRREGVDVTVTCEPGGTPLGRQLRRTFLETSEAVSPRAELLLFAADRAQHIDHLIRPALDAGGLVISDRYADATTAYQGAGRGFEPAIVARVIELATAGLRPDLTIFFDISVETAIRRMAQRSDSEATRNRMDGESFDFYSRVRNAYLMIAANEPERFRIVDAERPVAEIQPDVYRLVTEVIR